MSKKKDNGPPYLLVHYGLFGIQHNEFDDLDAARRRFAAYKELGMTGPLAGIYQKVEE